MRYYDLDLRLHWGPNIGLTWLKGVLKMTTVICKKHGWAAGEQVSKNLRDEFIHGHDISKKIRDFSFVIEEYECPFYGLQEEMEQLPEICVRGDFIVQSDERLSEVLGRITVMCIACLKEAMSDAPLPVKEGGA